MVEIKTFIILKSTKTNLVICNVIISAHALNLHWTEHPANVVNDFYVGGRGLLASQFVY